MQYRIDKGWFIETKLYSIDWENQNRTINTATLLTQRFASKWTSDCIGTGKNESTTMAAQIPWISHTAMHT